MQATKRRGALLAVLLGALVALLMLALATRAEPARAYAPGTWTPEQERIFKAVQKEANAAELVRSKGGVPTPEVEEAQKAARRVLSRSARKAIPRLAPHLISKGGLAGVAAGVWIHNGVAIYNGYQCGRTDCPEPLVLGAEFRQATEEAAALGAGNSVFKSYGSNNFLVATGMVTGVEYRWDPASYTCSVSVTVAVQRAPGAQGYNVRGPGKNRPDSSPFASTICDFGPMNLGGAIDGEATVEAERQTFTGVPARDVGQYSQMYTVEPSTGDYKRFGPPIYPYLSSSWKNPVYDVGSSTLESRVPAEGDYKATLEEGKALVDAVKGDAEYKPAWAEHEWNQPGYAPPRTLEDAKKRFGGEPNDSYDAGNYRCHRWDRDRVVFCQHKSGDGTGYVQYPDGQFDVFWGSGWRRIGVPKSPENRVTKTTYDDGTTVVREYPGGTAVQDLDRTTPNIVNWFAPDGSPRPAPAPGEYADDSIGERPIFEHPWGPNWQPGEDHPGLRPPGTTPGDEEIFGPETHPPELDGDWERVYFADGTVRQDHMNSTRRVYNNAGRIIVSHYPPGGPIEYEYFVLNEPPKRLEVGCVGESHVIKYANGVLRERVYPEGTLPSRFHDTTPVCEYWRDGSGAAMAPPADLAAYPVEPVPLPPRPPGHSGAWIS